jgi:hypothetical protein
MPTCNDSGNRKYHQLPTTREPTGKTSTNNMIEGKYSVDLIDNTGRVLLSKTIENDICKLDLNDINTGNYFVRVTSGKIVYTEILIKY